MGGDGVDRFSWSDRIADLAAGQATSCVALIRSRGAQTSESPHTMRLVDIQQVATKLEVSRVDARTLTRQEGFPRPAGYFRGRLLWEETAIHRWRMAEQHQQVG
jgi:predicted DNA-binding transcriptional regulator AlpA